MAYDKQTWAAGQAGGTPLSADRLNHLETGVQAAASAADSASSVAAAAVPATRTVAGHALSSNVTLTKADVGLSAAVTGSGIASIVAITQAAYDALGTKDSATLYVING